MNTVHRKKNVRFATTFMISRVFCQFQYIWSCVIRIHLPYLFFYINKKICQNVVLFTIIIDGEPFMKIDMKTGMVQLGKILNFQIFWNEFIEIFSCSNTHSGVCVCVVSVCYSMCLRYAYQFRYCLCWRSTKMCFYYKIKYIQW